MTDEPIQLTKALELAAQGGPEWDRLVAEMEQPKPWKHDWELQGNVNDFPGQFNPDMARLCIKCKRRVVYDCRGWHPPPIVHGPCSIPNPVTEPLELLIVRHIKKIVQEARSLSSFRFKLVEAIRCIAYQTGRLQEFAADDVTLEEWFTLSTNQQLLCCWLAEGRLEG